MDFPELRKQRIQNGSRRIVLESCSFHTDTKHTHTHTEIRLRFNIHGTHTHTHRIVLRLNSSTGGLHKSENNVNFGTVFSPFMGLIF